MSQTKTTELIPLQYWRAALAEASLLHPEVPPQSKPITIAYANGMWRVTSAQPGVAEWVAAQFESSKAAKTDKSTKMIPYVLIPARLSKAVSHGVKLGADDVNAGLSVLCIPCLLDRSGALQPDPDRQPWIPRDLLEPTLSPVAVGDLEAYDEFVGGLQGKATSFGETLQLASALYEAVTGASLPSLPTASVDADLDDEPAAVLAHEEYTLVAEWHGIAYEPPVVAFHLIKLYDQLISDAPVVPLLDSLRSYRDRPASRPLAVHEAEQCYANIQGHINPRHALSPSQREAMVELSRLEAGQVLSVNGPPGTGKTTLLQNVVAQIWVDAALAQAECPLVVVTSTNLKALENVLDSFAAICAETGHQRWHPYTGGFGLFFVSEKRESAIKHPTCTAKNHPFSEYESDEAVKTASSFFLQRASAFFGKQHDSLSGAVRALHGRLSAHDAKIKEIVSARFALYRATGQSVDEGAATSCMRLITTYQARIDAEQAVIVAADDVLRGCRREANDAESDCKTMLAAIGDTEHGWSGYLARSPLWLELFSFIGPVRRRRNARDRHFLISSPLIAECRHRDDGVEEALETLGRRAREQRAATLAEIARRSATTGKRRAAADAAQKAAAQAKAGIEQAFVGWKGVLGGVFDDMLNVSLDGLNAKIDLALRAPMFGIADHYWTGMWLVEMNDRLATGATDTKGRAKLEAKYRRFAKLSPCMVSNFHMASSFFTAWQGEPMPFWNTIDLLVVDEAGQVSPDIGAGMFALAKRALVVGDTYQIEPVWNAGEGTDRANAVRFGLTKRPHDPAYDILEEGGYTAASGNLMRIANRSCPVQKFDDMRGLMLTEHRRCVPELVAYCNKLIYADRLEPLREAIDPAERLLPPFGYMSVTSQDKASGTSRINHDEAQAIVHWLKANRERIERHYASPGGLWKLVGIVTPFAAQAGVIERVLRQEMPDLARKDSRLTIGTVHALQGAERAIVMFSPTYGASSRGGGFFDRKPNMMNVAVSRAKDSFLVIGNMSLFDPGKTSSPSGLLARFLFNGSGSAALDGAANASLAQPVE